MKDLTSYFEGYFEGRLKGRCAAALYTVQPALIMASAMVLVQLSSADWAVAQEGASVFEKYACSILGDVITGDFSAMVTAITGVLAIIAAAAGSFKGAWALLFVSCGAFIYPALVKVFFPDLQCNT